MDATSVFLVAGARPNFMKVAALYTALSNRPHIHVTLVHTGQHYDPSLSDVFFRDLELPTPHIALGVKAGTHGAQTGRVMETFEQQLLEHRPDLVVVVGDVNSTVACALATVKMHYPDGRRPKLAHVEAGLRSFDRTMPEEINRILTDAMSDYLFTTERTAASNLTREGVRREHIFFVGNVMIDTLLTQLQRARELKAWESLGLTPGTYAVVTVHRPSTVDSPDHLRRVVHLLRNLCARLPVVFPAHPRTARQLEKLNLVDELRLEDDLIVTGPLGYLEFLGLMSESRLVVTDSGGIQEETTVLGIPCLTLRDNTERPVTITDGTNRLVGSDPDVVLAAVDDVLEAKRPPRRVPELWDGSAAERIATTLEGLLKESERPVCQFQQVG